MAPELALALVPAPPTALPLPDVTARLCTVPVVLALPLTDEPPAARPGTAPAVPLPAAEAVAPATALFMLSALPLPELEAADSVPEDEFVDVDVAAMLEPLTAAEATPAKAITAIPIRDFFMIVPLKASSQTSEKVKATGGLHEECKPSHP